MQQKSFLPWSKENMPPPMFLKKVKETQGRGQRSFFELILDQDLEPNFRPIPYCKCPKLAKLTDRQITQETNKPKAPTSDNKQTTNDKIPSTVRKIHLQAQRQPRQQQTHRKIDVKSDWSDLDDGKDDQARSNPIIVDSTSVQEATIDPQPSTSNFNASMPLRRPSTYPKF